MTTTRKTTMLAAALAATLPTQAAPEAQDVFTALVQQEALAPMRPELRAVCLPALAYLPGEADAIFVAAQAGASAVELMKLLGCATPENAPMLSSIGSFAMCMSSGSAAAFERALPAMVCASQLTTLREWQVRWSSHAKPSLAEAINSGFRKQIDLIERKLQATLADYRPKPIYAALTAEPGRQDDFRRLGECLRQNMQRLAQKEEWQAEQIDGCSAALRTTQLHLAKKIFIAEPTNPELRQELAQRTVHLLLREEQGALLLILCEQPEEVSLPTSPGASLLHTPLLAGAEAHMEHLRAAAWVSPVFFRALQGALYAERSPLTLALADAFGALSAADAAHQSAYQSAMRHVLMLDAPPSTLPTITHPMEMQVWQSSADKLRLYAAWDAWGSRFEPGELRLAARATTPDTIYYAESTAFSSPYANKNAECCTAMVDIGRAMLLTLKDDTMQPLLPYIHAAQALAPEAQAMESSLRAIAAAMGSPLALVSGDGAPGEDPAVAICAAVKDRAALAEGWQGLLQSLGQAVAKIGLPPSVAADLPIETTSAGWNATSHTLRLPFLPQGMLPNVTLSDAYFVLGYSPALNARLLAAAADTQNRMPFTGAVCAFSFPGWAKTARTMTSRAGNTQGTAMRITHVLERLAAQFSLYLQATTIRDGAVSTGGVFYLK